MNRPVKKNPIKLRPGLSIGSISAETDDDFLFECFLYHPAYEEISKIQSPSMMLSGRTGSGKTAIIRMLESKTEHSTTIDPLEMSISYVSNSDAIRFLEVIGADLDLLFQALWKHVICIEFIRMFYNVNDEQKSRTVFARIFEKFCPQYRKHKPLEYLKQWEGKFWITMDQNIKEIIEKYESQFKTEFGGEIEKFKAGGQYEKRLASERKAEIVARFRKIVSTEQLSELSGVIDMPSQQAAEENMKRFYILIDRLDEQWVDVSIRFRLIRALIESLRSFRRITNLKIVAALRTDILERTIQENGNLTFHREKFDKYFLRLRWSKPQLKDLLDKRINYLFKRQYTQENVMFSDVFCHNVGSIDPFEYIVERTMLRPRDTISFVNECLLRVSEGSEITARIIRDAEGEYSRIRRQALESEWRSAFPTLSLVLDAFSGRTKANFEAKDLLASEEIDRLANKIVQTKKIDFDPLHDHAVNMTACESDKLNFIRTILETLYRVGAVGAKMQPTDRSRYSHADEPTISASSITLSTKFRIHDMLHRTLNIYS